MDDYSFQQTMHEKCQIDKTDMIIAAVSGGPDSICMVNLLIENEFKIVIAHYDHGIRVGSRKDLEAVRDYAKQKGQIFETETGNVCELAKSRKLSLEEAARIARYNFLVKTAIKHNSNIIALGHNADDQVETVLMHLLRGSGLDGLRGMSFRSLNSFWGARCVFIRPLLSVWRSEIMEYCQKESLHPVVDDTNFSLMFFRNRIRQELIPDLELYNPQIRKRIWQMADVIQKECELLDNLSIQAWSDCLVKARSENIECDRSEFLKKDKAMQRRLVRMMYKESFPEIQDIDFKAIGTILQNIENPPKSGSISLPQHIFLEVRSDRILLYKKNKLFESGNYPQLEKSTKKKMIIPGTFLLKDNWAIRAEVLDNHVDFQKASLNLFEAFLDIGDNIDFITIKAFQQGDKIDPLGLAGHTKKISDIWTDNKLHNSLREMWPIIEKNEKIIWLPGFCISENCKVTPNTKRVVHLTLRRILTDTNT